MENNVELNNIKLDNTGVNTPGTVGVDANTQQTQGDKSAWDIYTKKTHVIGRTVSIINNRLSSVYLYPRRIRFDGGQSSLFRFLFSRQRGNFDFDRPTSNRGKNTFRPEHRAVVFRETHVGPPRTATQVGSGVRILFQKKPLGIYVQNVCSLGNRPYRFVLFQPTGLPAIKKFSHKPYKRRYI